jgi:phenylalanyl-tRNA synthetase beta chain
MRVPLSWLGEYVDLPEVGVDALALALTEAGLKVEQVEHVGSGLSGVVVGRVLEVEELRGFAKPIRFATVDVGGDSRGVVCGATNFTAGDRVVMAVPGAALPEVGVISAVEKYGRRSDGMICSARELGVGEDHTGILVLDETVPVGADAVEALHLRDEVLDIDVNPDRGYALSMRGVAREAATAYGVAFHDPAAVPVPSPAGGPAYEVRVVDAGGCDRYVARVVTGLDPDAATPLELRRRLLLAGMRPISLPVDVTNLVLLGLGQPLHAFDRAKLTGPITVRRPGPGERLVTLDGVDRELDPEDLVIADDFGPVALAGVMGGASTEVGPGTTDLVIESAHFAPVTVARTERRHRLPSEASRRFERGVDDELPPAAAEVAARMLAELGGGTALPAVTDVDARPARPTIRLRIAYPGELAGHPYPAETVRRRLADVGCTLSGSDPVEVTPPPWRPDLRRPVDLVEEVVRLEGYDTVPSVLPRALPGPGLTREQRLRRAVGRALAAAGYVEAPTFPFLSASVWDELGLPADDPRREMVRVTNPLVESERGLRTSLLPGLLATLGRNVSRGSTDVGLFELGAVFLPRPEGGIAPHPPAGVRPEQPVLDALDAALPEQPTRVAAVLAGERERSGWWGPGREVGWADAVEAARTVACAVRVPVQVRQVQHAPWHPGRCAAVELDNRVIGYGGELHPRVCAALHLPARTCAMELDLEPLLAAAPEAESAPRVSAFPPATLDVAVVVPVAVPAAEVQAALAEGAGPMLESARLFDVFTGEQLGVDRKSLAFSLRLRAQDRTLTVEEANRLRDAAVAMAGERTGAVLRGT